ncbi:MAG TPA: HIT domain-containing protein [Candidatus Saccharimonadales bacterium]|nr:HIT domain-containing protein [Candidatus Saccharimonadales bacterium]
MSDSIFTKIIRGEIPCYKVYEDENTFAFLDIQPIKPGHVLVVPKKQVDIWDLSEEDFQALMETVRKIARRIQGVLNPKRVGIQVVGIDVDNHAHVHVFPFNNMAEYRQIPTPADDKDLREMTRKLRFSN